MGEDHHRIEVDVRFTPNNGPFSGGLKESVFDHKRTFLDRSAIMKMT